MEGKDEIRQSKSANQSPSLQHQQPYQSHHHHPHQGQQDPSSAKEIEKEKDTNENTKFRFDENMKPNPFLHSQSSFELRAKKPPRPPPPPPQTSSQDLETDQRSSSEADLRTAPDQKDISLNRTYGGEDLAKFKKAAARRVKSSEAWLERDKINDLSSSFNRTQNLLTVENTTPELISDDDEISDEEGNRIVQKQEDRRTSFVRTISSKLKNFGRRKSQHALSSSGGLEEDKKIVQAMTVDVIDLTSETVGENPPVMKVKISRKSSSGDKNDGSFSRSRSSSMSSLENISKEAIQCLVFADSYTRKTDGFTCPCLWVGTSLGSVLVIALQLPASGEARQTEPVIVSPSGTIFRLKGTILAMSFLDCNGILIPTISEQWKDMARDARDEKSRAPRQVSVNKPRMSPTSSTEMIDRQFAIICSEKQARVMSLPSQTCAYKVKITETSCVIKADVVNMKDSVCLACYVANGHLMAFSLPSLKLLLDVDFLPLTDLRVARTFSISNNGHALFFCSPTEVQKLTFSAETAENLQDMLGELFLPCDAPEAPKQGFFKNLFGGGGTSLDREELFGELSGKASKGLAKHIPGTGLQGAQEQAGIAMNEFTRTRQALTERGEKLGELDERTAEMMAQAESYARACHSLMDKYKNKKWYQF